MSDWPCLMYHDVTASGGAGGAGSWFSVTRARFGRQLDLIGDGGYSGCSISAALAKPDTRRIAISFDDGTAGQFEHAFPELVRRGMTATFFVTTGWVGTPGYATWDQLAAMKAAGMSIQSHSRSHPFLSELDAEAVRAELAGSKRELDERLQQATDTFALPGGDQPRGLLRTLFAEAGYVAVATSRWGRNRDAAPGEGIRFLNRCTIRGAPSDWEFQRVLNLDIWIRLRRRARESVLGTVRASLGPSRYARWRRLILRD